MRFWITRCAIAQYGGGIEEVEAMEPRASVLMVQGPRGAQRYFHREGQEWHRTREAAVERASVMLKKRLTYLESELTRLRALRFE